MFFTYDQNNTGGDFDYLADSGISHRVIVEADTADQANDKAEKIGLYFNGIDKGLDCSCCGDRWHAVYWLDEGDVVPSVFLRNVTLGPPEEFSYGIKPGQFEVFVHYRNGKFIGYWKMPVPLSPELESDLDRILSQ